MKYFGLLPDDFITTLKIVASRHSQWKPLKNAPFVIASRSEAIQNPAQTLDCRAAARNDER